MNAFPSPEQSFSKSAQLDESSGDLQHPETWSYETTIAQIEAIIARIELGELALKDVFDHFEIAVEHLQQCEEFLNHHQRRMDLLIETLTDEVENF